MNRTAPSILSVLLIASLLATPGCGASSVTEKGSVAALTTPKERLASTQGSGGGNQYTLEQAMSENAQLSTIAFSGLAFITGSSGADTFMPPGKVADFFGFQYMRDVDTAGYGHNTTFLSRVANNVLYILNDSQKAKLVALAQEQAPLYNNFAYNRFPLMNAFRRSLEGDIPSGSSGLDISAVADYTGSLYKIDAELSYNRARVVGEIISSFSDEQKSYLAKMQFNNYNSWPAVEEDETLKRSMTNTEFVAVMTYASELFSWYKGSLEADVYFCPERHGTYFGGFYMKDYPAMNNPDYFISTAITGDSGKEFLATLNTEQRALITGIIAEQSAALAEIAEIRTTVSTELRKAMTGGAVDQGKVYTLIQRYGELDGQMSALYASRFSQVNKTLSDSQRATLVKLRNLTVIPNGAYRFSTPVAMPEIPNTDFLFGVGTPPASQGQWDAPASFTESGSKTLAGDIGENPAGGDKGKLQTPKTDSPSDQQPGKQPQKGTAVGNGPKLTVKVNEQDVKFDTPPVIQDGRTLVPVRAITEALGAEVQWNAATQTVTITKGSTIIQLIIGKNTATVNGKSVKLDVAATNSNGSTVVPLRFVSEALNLKVLWEQEKNTIKISGE